MTFIFAVIFLVAGVLFQLGSHKEKCSSHSVILSLFLLILFALLRAFCLNRYPGSEFYSLTTTAVLSFQIGVFASCAGAFFLQKKRGTDKNN